MILRDALSLFSTLHFKNQSLEYFDLSEQTLMKLDRDLVVGGVEAGQKGVPGGDNYINGFS